MNAGEIRLTRLAHGGGCGCKLAPSVLQALLSGQVLAPFPQQLLVGIETGDDAAVWQLDDNTCIIATTDFFMPMVDDPNDFGRIAASNAISDVYAMGGKPIMALAILGMPVDKIPIEAVKAILAGGAGVCASVGIPVAGGHSIDCPEPVYGLAVVGTARPEHIRRNSTARPGDALILTKPIGVGIYSAAIKKQALPAGAYAELMATTTLLNRIGVDLAREVAVHAITDVTGFGLLGHGLEMARGSDLRLAIALSDVPMLSHTTALARDRLVTGASDRNWASYGREVAFATDIEEWQRDILTDPQTSGGLLVSCAADQAHKLLRTIINAGYSGASIIGRVEVGVPGITVR